MIDEISPLVLGSASPRRREILATLGTPCVVRPADVDERLAPGEGPEAYLARVVAAKLDAVSAMQRGEAMPAVEQTGFSVASAGILVADTIVIARGEIAGKPVDRTDAERMLRLLSGDTHEVRTRFAVRTVPRPAVVLRREDGPREELGEAASEEPRDEVREEAQTVSTRVTFRVLEESEIVAYAATGEGLDKAGAYAVQGVGSFAVERIDGSYTNVVGLPACELVVVLGRLGLLGRFPR